VSVVDSFFEMERANQLPISQADGWRVFGPGRGHILGIGTDDVRVYVEPAIKRGSGGMVSARFGVADAEANCYAVSAVTGLESGYESHSEIVAFERAVDAVEFAQLAALYMASTPTPRELAHRDFQPGGLDPDPWKPDPIIASTAPRDVAENLLRTDWIHLDRALDYDQDHDRDRDQDQGEDQVA